MFTCRANSTAVIQWTFNGGNLPNNVQVGGTGGYKSVLTIETVLHSNEGLYRCVAHSQSGVFSASASLKALFYGMLPQPACSISLSLAFCLDPEQDLMLVLAPLQLSVTRGTNTSLSCTTQSSSELR